MTDLRAILELCAWATILVALLISLRRAELVGKKWLLGFVGLSTLTFVVGFLTPIFAWQRDDFSDVMLAWHQYVNIPLTLVAHVCLVLFAFALLRAEEQSSGRLSSAANRPWYRPPSWLLAAVIVFTGACLLHNINGQILRGIVSLFSGPTRSGARAATDYANQLEFLDNVANVVGGLYIATALSWIALAGSLAQAFLAHRRRIQASGS